MQTVIMSFTAELRIKAQSGFSKQDITRSRKDKTHTDIQIYESCISHVIIQILMHQIIHTLTFQHFHSNCNKLRLFQVSLTFVDIPHYKYCSPHEN